MLFALCTIMLLALGSWLDALCSILKALYSMFNAFCSSVFSGNAVFSTVTEIDQEPDCHPDDES